MTISAIIALLLATAKAIPALSGLCSQLILWLDKYDKSKNEADAIKRFDEKNAAVRDAVNAHRVRSSSKNGQQSSTNETTRLP